METKQQQESGKSEAEAKSVSTSYSLNMMVFFAVLWAVSFMTIFYTADVRQAVPTWVNDVISNYARTNSNDSYEAQGDIYADRSFSYSIYDRQDGLPLKVKFNELPDEKQVEYSLSEEQGEEEKPAVEEPPPTEGELNEEGQPLRIASEGECLIQIKEIAIHEASKLGGADGDSVATRSGVGNFYAHVNIDDIIVKKGELLFYKKPERGEN